MEQCEPDQLCCGLGLTVDVTLESRVTNFMLLSDVEGLEGPLRNFNPQSTISIHYPLYFYLLKRPPSFTEENGLGCRCAQTWGAASYWPGDAHGVRVGVEQWRLSSCFTLFLVRCSGGVQSRVSLHSA